jgi:hypothetical protein
MSNSSPRKRHGGFTYSVSTIASVRAYNLVTKATLAPETV